MKCPKCGDDLKVLYIGTSTATGIECVICKTRWASARVQAISDDLRERTHYQLSGIVKYMDFDSTCVEMTKEG
jgi:formate dehydrogenase maturation protein FdhE